MVLGIFHQFWGDLSEIFTHFCNSLELYYFERKYFNNLSDILGLQEQFRGFSEMSARLFDFL